MKGKCGPADIKVLKAKFGSYLAEQASATEVTTIRNKSRNKDNLKEEDHFCKIYFPVFYWKRKK